MTKTKHEKEYLHIKKKTLFLILKTIGVCLWVVISIYVSARIVISLIPDDKVVWELLFASTMLLLYPVLMWAAYDSGKEVKK